MKKNLITYSITVILIAITAVSCSDESELCSADGDGAFRLASDKGVFTRAETETTFKEETAYQLYAIEKNDFSKNYLNNPANGEPATGKESADHNSITGIQANKFDGKTLDFYGVTNGTGSPVVITSNTNAAPTCAIENKDNSLTDVMWAKKMGQTNANSGTIKLVFKHTLAKVNLYVMKNSEYKGTEVALKTISLTDYSSGNLNMETGKFNLHENDKRATDCSVYNGSQIVGDGDAQAVKTENVQVAHMVFPTRKENLVASDRENHSLKVKVSVGIAGTSTITQETEILSTMAEGANAPTEVPFNFESNHEYDMVITITKSSLVVTIVPRAYDWIPSEDVKTDDQVNGSMTIGGITWMDRNLGATSGNPLASDQAWEYNRGYFYQFGRNIPYFTPMKGDSKGIMAALSNGNWHEEESMPYPFIPGYVSPQEPIGITVANNNTNFESIAQQPTDSRDKHFNFYYSQGDRYDWDLKHNASGSNWNTPAGQPCPKGWRMPTVDEFKLIIPSTDKAGDITFSLEHGGEVGSGLNFYTQEESSDPENGSSSIYIGVRRIEDHSRPTVGRGNSIYALKRKGTNNAYYLRWHIEKAGNLIMDNRNTNSIAKGDSYRNVLVISRYPATSSSSLSEESVATAAIWDKPVEQIKLPISGYVHVGKGGTGDAERPSLIYSGTEAVYWTSSTNGDSSYTVRMKFAGDHDSSQIMIYGSEIRSNGCLIRCVRDTKAN